MPRWRLSPTRSVIISNRILDSRVCCSQGCFSSDLIELSRGDTAVITQIRSPDIKMRDKLLARGPLPGAEIALMQAGNPLVVGLEHSRWALNRSEASHIEVSRIERPAKKRRAWISPFRRSPVLRP